MFTKLVVSIKHHGYQIVVAIDQVLNTLLGGWADETLSSRCYRWHRDGKCLWPMNVVDRMFWWDKRVGPYYCEYRRDQVENTTYHCELAYLIERDQRHVDPEMRN